jgi:hypothetical protein
MLCIVRISNFEIVPGVMGSDRNFVNNYTQDLVNIVVCIPADGFGHHVFCFFCSPVIGTVPM